jgi:anti-sigma B factor antagonist
MPAGVKAWTVRLRTLGLYSMCRLAALSARAPEPFSLDVESFHGKVLVRPHGEVDIATAPRLDVKLRELRDSGFDHLVVDLREVAFLDSSGLRILLAWDQTARQEGVDFELVPGPPGVQRLFDVTGVRDHLRFVVAD